jgi:hypothetical protein
VRRRALERVGLPEVRAFRLRRLAEEEAAWEWDQVNEEENGPTKNPPDAQQGWQRWYFNYHEPSCTNIKISADREPKSGKWFNPHRSSGTI